jgi:gamma-glutamylcyclotransferase (GGCT)/AIG2-like uncharacterized protein YtfP
MRIVTYGNFRRGEALSYYLDHLRINGESEIIELSGLKLFVVGMAPGAKITGDKKDKAVVELIEAAVSKHVEKAILETLDSVEGVDIGLYKRELIDTPRGEANIYTYCDDAKKCISITDWKVWQKSSRREKIKAIRKAGKGAIILGATAF